MDKIFLNFYVLHVNFVLYTHDHSTDIYRTYKKKKSSIGSVDGHLICSLYLFL